MILLIFLMAVSDVAHAKSIDVRKFRVVADPVETYFSECKTQDDSPACDTLRSLVYLHLTDDMEILSRSKDQRAVQPAMEALDLPNAELQLESIMALGKWGNQQGVAEKIYPFLHSGNPAMEHYAALALQKSENEQYRRLSGQYLEGHPANGTGQKMITEDLQVPDYLAAGHIGYPSSVRYSCGDFFGERRQTAGLMTSDPLKKVLEYFKKLLKISPVNAETQQQMAAEQQDLAEEEFMNHPKAIELQRLMDQFAETQNPELLKRIDSLQAELNEIYKDLKEPGPFAFMVPVEDWDSEMVQNARWFFIPDQKTNKSKINRGILVYYDDFLKQTVIQLSWKINR